MLKQTTYPDSFFVNLQSLDLGDIHSPDGRAHPLTALTPVVVTESAPVVDVHPTTVSGGASTGPSYTPAGLSLPGVLSPSSWLPEHAGARLAVGLLALGLLLIVAARLAR